MEVSPQSGTRRRTRDEVQADVRAALVDMLGEQPFKDVTVDGLARRAGLSRTAFYFYYPDKNEVLKEAAEAAAGEVYAEADRWWHGEGPPEQLVKEALAGIARVYCDHADMLRASVEATTYDKEFRAFYESLIQRFVQATADHLRRERDAGRLRSLDPVPIAEALVWMAERCNYAFLLVEGRPQSDVVEPLAAIWIHAIYPDQRST
jgi:TetR/AcrR family transcriptional regulator, ethionamide resistance regulator